MTVIPFPELVRVEIVGGTVWSATMTDRHGTRPLQTEVGQTRYFVDVVEPDGGRMGMWDGKEHAEAVRQANLLAVDFGGKVRDLTGAVA